MTLRKLFLIFGGLVAVITLAMMSGLYWYLQDSQAEINRRSASSLAEGLAVQMENRLELLAGQVTAVANMPAVARLASHKQMPLTIGMDGGGAIPGCGTLRLVSPERRQPLESLEPPIGFAELELVLATSQFDPQPALHGVNSTPYIAVARPVSQGGRHIAVLLAYCDYAWVSRLLEGNASDQVAFQLQQSGVVVAKAGPAALLQGAVEGEVLVGSSSDWKISYSISGHRAGQDVFFAALSTGLVLLFTLVLFLFYRFMSNTLLKDQQSLVKATSDLIAGKAQGAYPVVLRELSETISQVAMLRKTHRGPVARPAAEQSFVGQDSEAVPPAVTRKTPLDHLDFMTELPAAGTVPSQVVFADSCIMGPGGQALGSEQVSGLGMAIASEAMASGHTAMMIGHDGSEAGSAQINALASGMQACGLDVVDCGAVIAPMLCLAMDAHDIPHAVMISSNPCGRGGLVSVWFNSSRLHGEDLAKLEKRFQSGDYTEGSGSYRSLAVDTSYREKLLTDIASGISMNLVIDCTEGALTALADEVLGKLGCDVAFVDNAGASDDRDRLTALGETVGTRGAALGVILESSGTRLLVVDSAGRPVDSGRIMSYLSRDILLRNPGADVVVDEGCTRGLAAEISNNGGKRTVSKGLLWALEDKVRSSQAVLGGSSSGYLILGDRWPAFADGFYALLRVLELLSAEPVASASVFADLPALACTESYSIALPEGPREGLMAKLREKAAFADARLSEIQGLRYDFADSWGLVKIDPDHGKLTCQFEAKSRESLQRVQEQFSAWLGAAEPAVQLPFH